MTRSAKQRAKKLLSLPLVGLIYLYRYGLSPILPMACRYQPTCSLYALEALQRHGPFTGSMLALRRILSCHPWGGEGYDPVPPTAEEAKRADQAHKRSCKDGA